jgi:hypothetical protein
MRGVNTPREEPSVYVAGPYDRPTGAIPTPVTPAPRDMPWPVVAQPRKRRAGLIVGLSVAVVVVLAAAAGGTIYVLEAAGHMTVRGTVTIRDMSSVTVSSLDGVSCGGTDGYDDLAAGGAVNITDAGAATVAIGHLDAGKYDSAHGCVLPWTVSSVPTGKGFYGVAVGHRAAIKVPEAQMRQVVAMTIGS